MNKEDKNDIAKCFVKVFQDNLPDNEDRIFEKESAVQICHKIGKILQAQSTSQLNKIFDEFDVCNQMVTSMSQIQAVLLQISPESFTLLVNTFRTSDWWKNLS